MDDDGTVTYTFADDSELSVTEDHKITIDTRSCHGESVLIAIEPDEPDCEASEHDWESPHSVVGGIESDPGVRGSGGGVLITEVCRHCGLYRIVDTWAQHCGVEGLTSVEYRDADEHSSAWALARNIEIDLENGALGPRVLCAPWISSWDLEGEIPDGWEVDYSSQVMCDSGRCSYALVPESDDEEASA